MIEIHRNKNHDIVYMNKTKYTLENLRYKFYDNTIKISGDELCETYLTSSITEENPKFNEIDQSEIIIKKKLFSRKPYKIIPYGWRLLKKRKKIKAKSNNWLIINEENLENL